MKKGILIAVLCIVIIAIIVVAVVCGKNVDNKSQNSNSTKTSTAKNTTSTKTNTTKTTTTINYAENAEKQMAMPNEGDTIAIFKVKDYGEMKVKFFPEVAPKAVENFTTHAKNGYYDGLTFHRIINEFMIQGGDPLGNGTGGESIWGEGFGTELSKTLVPYRGSLCMAMSSLPNSIGSQFFITQAHYSEEMYAVMKQNNYPADLLTEYKEYGGYLSLYMNYTVFGQVYEGLDVLDKIAGVETDSNDKPLEDVIIETIEVTTYTK